MTLNIHIKSTNQYESIFLKPWMSKKKKKKDFGIFMCKYFVHSLSNGYRLQAMWFSQNFIFQVPIFQGYHAI